MEEAAKFYSENKENLLSIMLNEFKGNIDYQAEWDQVAVWFPGFSLCYQNGDMNGDDKGTPCFNNDGANNGLTELKEILKKDERFQPLVASEEYWKNEYVNEIINDFCIEFAKQNNIASYFINEDA